MVCFVSNCYVAPRALGWSETIRDSHMSLFARLVDVLLHKRFARQKLHGRSCHLPTTCDDFIQETLVIAPKSMSLCCGSVEHAHPKTPSKDLRIMVWFDTFYMPPHVCEIHKNSHRWCICIFDSQVARTRPNSSWNLGWLAKLDPSGCSTSHRACFAQHINIINTTREANKFPIWTNW